MNREFHWPEGFERIPEADWTSQPLDRLALHYDSVEQHGWYRNLDPTVEAAAAALADGALCIDYSGGTGIFTDRLLRRTQGRGIGVVIVDSSPKFLRLALEKFRDHPQVAFRLIRWLRDEHRLELLEEALDPELAERGADVVVSTNAIHLYYDLPETVASWRRVIRNGGRLLVQSGNVRNPEAPEGAWIIDETVGHIHRAAVELVGLDDRWTRFRPFLEDEEHMAAHRTLREKVFLPVRDLDYYVGTIEDAGFAVVERSCRAIEARVEDWYDFLAVYHDAVLGWAGGAEKVTGREPGPDAVALRRRLLRVAMDRVFDGADEFTACWTYLTAEPI